ncbi:MAG: carbon-phosphorus lyase complex subunit PhnI, partial [Oceanidesulfovibrio sp.]
MYVAIKGGERAIRAAHALLDAYRRGDPDVPELTLEQIREQLGLAVDRVMSEGSLYDPDFAALATKQAQGDLVEAIFLLRAYRTTLPRLGESEPVDTTGMHILRRVSAVYKDLPGGQVLGPTFDYTHRLLDFELADGRDVAEPSQADAPLDGEMPRVLDWLKDNDLIEPPDGREIPGADEDPDPGDITLSPLELPADRDVRLQCLARADEGFLLSMAYSTQRGFGRNHPFAGEIRTGEVSVEICPEELGFPISVADITVTEADMINQFK